MGYIDSGVKEGATLHVGGQRFGQEGYFIEPTIFTNTRPDMKIVREEIFGPVGVVAKFSTEEEVLELANDTQYGLSSYAFTRDVSRAIRVANALEAGCAFVSSLYRARGDVADNGVDQLVCAPRAASAVWRVQAIWAWQRNGRICARGVSFHSSALEIHHSVDIMQVHTSQGCSHQRRA